MASEWPLEAFEWLLFTVPTIVVLNADNELLSKALANVHSISNQQE